MKFSPIRRRILPMVSQLSLSLLLALPLHAQTPTEVPPAAVHVAPLEQRTVQEERTFVGDVVPLRRTIIGSAVDGRVDEVFVDEGDPVGLDGQSPQDEGQQNERGVPIAQLRVRTISIQVAAAAAELELRKRELEELETGARPEEKNQAKARMEAAKAVWEYAKARYDRALKLGSTASQEELDKAQSETLAAKQELLAAQAALELVEQGPRKEQIEQARARVAAAQEQLNLQEDIRTKFTVRSPIRGYVVKKLTEEGQWVKSGDAVAEIVEVDPIEIQVPVPQDYVRGLRPGMEVVVRASNSDDQMIGKVHRIIPQADSRSRTFPVLIHLDNPLRDGAHALLPGMLVRVSLGVGGRREAIMAPKDALNWDGQKASLYLVDPNAKKGTNPGYIPLRVQLGVIDGSQIEIVNVMDGEMPKPGQMVVTIGNERLQPRQPLRILKIDSPRSSSAETAATSGK